ncbi:hypothetical protein PUR23_14380 [Methylorubrum populi]|uniref:Uncharacterized protein n=1 Tax=Methylobacterium brachiatum TaxID=269660 RepID=A0AAJ1TRB3_9HYPH|nr:MULTISPECIES: hypothetical protein [Methylobacterium]MCB4802808.1 hypothetical protein [Methylobacterium brachiatum]MDQ0543444.1 hypothetical protein [Methylobacterium brachiatum]
MDAVRLRRDLDRAAAELETIDRRIADLARRRKLVEAFIASGKTLLNDLSSSGVEPSNAVVEGFEPAPRKARRKASRGPNEVLSESRRFNNEVAMDALNIIKQSGKPLSAREIFSHLHYNDRMGPDALYTLLYKRAYHQSHFRNVAGKFWPIDQPLPAEAGSD